MSEIEVVLRRKIDECIQDFGRYFTPEMMWPDQERWAFKRRAGAYFSLGDWWHRKSPE